MERVGAIRCLLAAALFGASAPAASVLAGDMPAVALAGLLYLGAAMAVLPTTLRQRPDRRALQASWAPIAVAVVAGGALGPALLVAGLARTDAATGSILLNLELVATVALAAAFFHEHLGARVLAGAALVTLGGMLLVWEPGASADVGALLIAAACLCWGLDNCVTARLDHIAPEHVVLIKGTIAGTANLALGLTVARGAGSGVGGGEIAAALLIGAIGYGASITLWVKGARDLGAARGQILFATAPFIGATIAWVGLHDPVNGAQIAAVLLAAAGVTLSLRSGHEHAHHHEPVVHEHEHTHDDGHHAHVHDDGSDGRGSHRHEHPPLVHVHPHVPDLHHRHVH
jgi:drug/metabolite transporter (DMT)-like permease